MDPFQQLKANMKFLNQNHTKKLIKVELKGQILFNLLVLILAQFRGIKGRIIRKMMIRRYQN